MARLFSELQNEVLDHGFSATRYRARVGRWINDALGRVARRVDLPAEDVSFAIATTVGDSSYALPADLARIESLRRDDPDRNYPLAPEDRETLDLAPRTQGQPVLYALDGTNLMLWPTPSGQFSLSLRYHRTPGQLVDDDPSPLPNEYDDLLVCYALWRCYRSEDDAEMARDYERQWRDGLLEIAGDVHGRDPNHVRQVGGMLDVWGDDLPYEPDIAF